MTLKDAEQFIGENVKVTVKGYSDKVITQYGDIWFFNGVGFNKKFLSFSKPRKNDKGTMWTPDITTIKKMELL